MPKTKTQKINRLYIRLINRDTWHFYHRCWHYRNILWLPLEQTVRRYTKPTTGELCNQCKAKQKKADRRTG